MGRERIVPSLSWLVAISALGAVAAVAVISLGNVYLVNHADNVYELTRSNDTLRTYAGITAAVFVGVGVFVDAEMFRRRGHRVAEVPSILWAVFVGGLLIFTFPLYCYFRSATAHTMVTNERTAEKPGASPVVLGAVVVVGWIAVVTGAVYVAPRLFTPTAFVVDDSDVQEAETWVHAQGIDGLVICDVGRIVHAGEHFICQVYDNSNVPIAQVDGFVPDGASHATWTSIR